MVNLTWNKSSEAELEKAYRSTDNIGDKTPYYGTPIVYRGNTGLFSGDDGVLNWLFGNRYLFLVIETKREKMGAGGIHYIGCKQNVFSFRSSRQNYNRSDVIRDFNLMLELIGVGRTEFFESLENIFEKESTEQKTLESLINMLNPNDFGKAEKELAKRHKEALAEKTNKDKKEITE